MTYLVLGLSVLVGLGLMGRWLLNAEPKTLLKILKWFGFAALGLVGRAWQGRGGGDEP